MRVEIGEVAFELTHQQAESLRRQLGVVVGAEGMIDAAEVAKRLGVNREYVYRHKAELGGVQVGDSRCAPWRFDWGRVQAAMAARNAEGAPAARPAPQTSTALRQPGRRRRRPQRTGSCTARLEIRGDGPYAPGRHKAAPGRRANANRGPDHKENQPPHG